MKIVWMILKNIVLGIGTLSAAVFIVLMLILILRFWVFAAIIALFILMMASILSEVKNKVTTEKTVE